MACCTLITTQYATSALATLSLELHTNLSLRFAVQLARCAATGLAVFGLGHGIHF